MIVQEENCLVTSRFSDNFIPFFVFQAQRRGITLDVWETIIDVSGAEYDVMFGQPGIQLKRVITHFFSNETIMEDVFRQVLIMSLVTDYTDDGVERQIKSQKELSYFDFRELNFGQTYLDTFSVADCVTEPGGRRYFDIFVKHIGQYSFLYHFSSSLYLYHLHSLSLSIYIYIISYGATEVEFVLEFVSILMICHPCQKSEHLPL